jgi:hypothetical protein
MVSLLPLPLPLPLPPFLLAKPFDAFPRLAGPEERTGHVPGGIATCCGCLCVLQSGGPDGESSDRFGASALCPTRHGVVACPILAGRKDVNGVGGEASVSWQDAGSCCVLSVVGALPSPTARMLVNRWFRSCRPRPSRECLFTSSGWKGGKDEARAVGRGKMRGRCSVSSVVRALPSRPVRIDLTRWFRYCRPRPSRQCLSTCPSCFLSKARVAYSGA